MMLLTVRRASLGYHSHQPVLHDVPFQASLGSVCCLIGTNDNGKTTLIRTILGVLSPFYDDILPDGVAVNHLSNRQRAVTTTWIPQACDDMFAFTALDMVMMGLAPQLATFTIPDAKERENTRQQMTMLGIFHLAPRHRNTLGGGGWQLVLIVRVLTQCSRFLLLDKPTSSLDLGHQIRLLDMLVTPENSGMTLLMPIHHPLHARAIADSVVRAELDGGVSQGLPEHQLAIDRLAALYRIIPLRIIHHLFGSRS